MSAEQTFLDLLVRYDGSVRRIARVYGGPDGEQEDLYQEILMQLWRSFPSFRGNAAPGTWLYRVALNTALSWRRRARTRYKKSVEHGQNSPPAVYQHGRSATVILDEFLAGLGGSDRTVLLLYMEGLSYQEIADVTGVNPGALGVRIHRIKKDFTNRYLGGR